LFAFGIDDKNPENFLLFAQENDFWWLSEIGIEYFTFIEKYLIIKFLPLNYVNLNLSSENKIRIRSLTISIPLSDMYYDHLQQYIPAFKNAYIGKIDLLRLVLINGIFLSSVIFLYLFDYN